MTALPYEETDKARDAKPGDIWYAKRNDKPATIIRQDGKLHLIYAIESGKRFRDLHFKFALKYRTQPPKEPTCQVSPQ